MRTIETHKSNFCAEFLTVTAADERGSGGANHRYLIAGFDPITNPSHGDMNDQSLDILFQQGDPATVGVNGITSEALLAVLIDRHQGFADGPFPSEENRVALDHIKQALDWLHQRTRNRQARGVEGKLEK